MLLASRNGTYVVDILVDILVYLVFFTVYHYELYKLYFTLNQNIKFINNLFIII